MGEHCRLVSLMLAEGFLSVIFFLSSALSQLSAHQFFLALLQVSSLGLSHIWRWVKSQNPTIIYGARASLLFISAEVDWVFFAHVLSPEFARAGRLSLDLPPEELGTLRTHVELETWQSNKDGKITNTTNNHVGIPPTETRCNLRFPDEIGRVTSPGWFPQNTICPDIAQMFMPGMMPGEYSHGPFIMIAISRSGGLMIAIVVSFVFVTPPWFPTTDRGRLPLLLHQVLLQQRLQTSPCAAHARSCDSRRCAEDAPDETGTSRDQRLAKRI